MTTPHPPAGRRGWAYAGAALGGVVSVAANIAHSYVPPPGAPPAWQPHTGAVIGAVFWPVALLVAVEILARTTWPAGWCWLLLRFAGLTPVALVAAVVSYRHLSGLLLFYREDALTVVIGPLAVDGLMVMASAALIATSRHATTTAVADATAAHVAPDPAATSPVTRAGDAPAARVEVDSLPRVALDSASHPGNGAEAQLAPRRRDPAWSGSTNKSDNPRGVESRRLHPVKSSRPTAFKRVGVDEGEVDPARRLAEAVQAGVVDPGTGRPIDPCSAESIRRTLRVGAATARAIRLPKDAVAATSQHPADQTDPGDIDQADPGDLAPKAMAVAP